MSTTILLPSAATLRFSGWPKLGCRSMTCMPIQSHAWIAFVLVGVLLARRRRRSGSARLTDGGVGGGGGGPVLRNRRTCGGRGGGAEASIRPRSAGVLKSRNGRDRR